MKIKNEFFLKVQPWQGLLESWLVGLLILDATSHLEGYVDAFIFQTAVFFLCGACGMWAVLRIRIPKASWRKQFIEELTIGLALSLIMVFGERSLSQLLHWDAAWRLIRWDFLATTILLAATGCGYVGMRIVVRLWQRWDRMRRERMLWALTHAHLSVVAFFGLMAALLIFILVPYSGTAAKIWAETKDPLASIVTGFLATFFPIMILIVALSAFLLVFMLPPLALFSYWVARRTTKRLEALTVTTAALRGGDYRARVPVEGEDEVARLQADFNAMAEKLETTLADLKDERDTVAQVLQSRRDLIVSVSHELRTPVATLQAALETTLQKWQKTSPPEARRDLGVMEAEIGRLSGLIDDLFTLSQADVANLSLECAPTDLAGVIEQSVSSIAALAWNTARVEVSAELPDCLPAVTADPKRLQQVLLNLLRNAVRYTPPGGIVAVLAAEEEKTLRIEVRDTGAGIDPPDLEHIWERFYRAKNTTGEGAGLGLALVKELVEGMGGSVSAESVLGQGSCFSIRLLKA